MFQMNQLHSLMCPNELRHSSPPFLTTGVDDCIFVLCRFGEDAPAMLCRSSLALSEGVMEGKFSDLSRSLEVLKA